MINSSSNSRLSPSNNSSANCGHWIYTHQKTIKIVLSISVIIGLIFTILAGLALSGQLSGIPPSQYLGSFLGTDYYSLPPLGATFLFLGIFPLMGGEICLTVLLCLLHCPKQQKSKGIEEI
jgi:hypothetical protein